jgi:serine phosphatase RsbU (regulator of sigma subunit)/anti-sigma regulatory factor (Ser/Thr protein kinase)
MMPRGWGTGSRGGLPRGGLLPEQEWASRHRAIIYVLLGHAIFIPIYGLLAGYSVGHIALEAAILPALLLGATWRSASRASRTLIASIGLLTSSAILVHLSGGLIEMHFHFFVMVAVVSLYQAWLPFLAAISYVLIHHGIMGAVAPEAVFNHPAAQRSPWLWASIHALFIAAISAACLVGWRLQERSLEQRRAAEDRWRDESATVARLNNIGLSLNTESDIHEVMQKVTHISTQLTEAAFGAFFHNVDDGVGGKYLLYTLSGAPPEAFANFPMPRATKIFAPTFAGEAPVRLDDVTADPRYGKSPPYHGMPEGHLKVRSYLAVPVTSPRGEVLGGLFFGHPEVGRFTEEHEKLAVGVAAHAGVALENARLHDSEKRSVARLSVIAEAGRRLSASLELEALLDDLADVLTPAIADLCVVYLRQADGEVRAVTMRGSGFVHPDLSSPANLPRSLPAAGPVAEAMRTGKPQILREITEEILETGVSDPRFRQLLRESAVDSAIMLPLQGRDEVLGALSLATVKASGRSLTDEDLSLAEEVARRASVAVEHARLYQAQRAAAITLQHSLLPERLPEVTGVETAARYIPGGDGVEIGGDWYDVIALPDGSLGLVMGDVVGRGVEAAALMGQLRNGLRALAMEGLSPAAVVARLNRLLLELGPVDGLATLVFAAFDPETGTLRMTNAGHPPPLVIGIGTEAVFLDEGRGLPLGASPRAEYTEAITTLTPGATIVLYTDGLVEDRSTPLDVGLARLAEAAVDGDGLGSLCDQLLERCLVGRDVKDDIAVLALRTAVLGPELRLRLPSRPEVLRPLRSTLRRWLHACDVRDEEFHDVLVAVGEACANAIQHAGAADRDFEIDASIDTSEIRVMVRDQGSWRPPRPSDWGRGIAIMERVMDSVDIERTETGTQVLMRRRRQTGEGWPGIASERDRGRSTS